MVNHHGYQRKVATELQKDTKPSNTKAIFNIATFIGKTIYRVKTYSSLHCITENKVVPIVAVLFTIVYWSYSIYCYGQDGQS